MERSLGMVDGCVLLVDATEGPLAQTKFVVLKALQRGLRPLLLINKVDRDAVTEERCAAVASAVFDLFATSGADDDQLDFPILYASARQGWAAESWEAARAAVAGQPHAGMAPLLDAVVRHVPPPGGLESDPFAMVVSMMERDAYLGRVLTGRVASGCARVGDPLRALSRDGAGASHADGRITRILKRRGGFGRVTVDCATAGDVVSIAGVPAAFVTDTLAAPEVALPLPAVAVDPPTLGMLFSVNDSPLAGRDPGSSQLTGSKIGARLLAEAESNVSIRVQQEAGGGDTFAVQGRGELQLGVLIEEMRREGFELSVSPPEVLLRPGPDGGMTEPWEELTVEVDEAHCGPVIDALSTRGAEVRDMHAGPAGKSRIQLRCPSRGLLGWRSVFAGLTRGGGIMHRAFEGYCPVKPGLDAGRKGVLVSMADGTATAYALNLLEERGTLFVGPGAPVFGGMIVGENARGGDMEVNPTREKKLTNVRNTGSEEQVRLTPPRRFGVEEALGYVRAGELVEITPSAVRMRKRALDASGRKVARRGA